MVRRGLSEKHIKGKFDSNDLIWFLNIIENTKHEKSIPALIHL